MIAIRNSKLFVLITLLLSITTFVYAGFWVIFLGVVAVIAAFTTVILGAIEAIELINNFIRDEEQTLQELKDERADADKEREANRDRFEELDDLILEEDCSVRQAQSDLYTAELEYDAAETAYDAAKTDVTEKSEAYNRAKTAYDDHVYDCYYCEGSIQCTTGTQLSNQMSKAQEALRQAKVSRTFAKSRYDSAEKEKNKMQSKLDEHTKKRDKYEEEQNELAESHATLLIQISTLDQDIETKEEGIKDAKADLGTETDKKSTAETKKAALEDWKNRGMAAFTAGEDMNQWIENNPPPEY